MQSIHNSVYQRCERVVKFTVSVICITHCALVCSLEWNPVGGGLGFIDNGLPGTGGDHLVQAGECPGIP